METLEKIAKIEKKLCLGDFSNIFKGRACECYKAFQNIYDRNLCAFFADLKEDDKLNFLNFLKWNYHLTC